MGGLFAFFHPAFTVERLGFRTRVGCGIEGLGLSIGCVGGAFGA